MSGFIDASDSLVNVPQLQGDHQFVTDVRTFNGPENMLDLLDPEALTTVLGGTKPHFPGLDG